MLWLFAILLTLVCAAVLFMAVRRADSAIEGVPQDDPTRAFYRDQLAGIERDQAQGRLSDSQAQAAKAELAREILRSEKATGAASAKAPMRPVLFSAIFGVGVVSLVFYAFVGRADLPAQPLADRVIAEDAAQGSIEDAIAMVEARLEENPNDVRGWLALAPIYMEQERFTEAANAYRRVLSLEPATADLQTNLAEALIMANGGEATSEALDLLEAAAASNPAHVRSRFYLAGELTRAEDFEAAVPLWQELIALSSGDEPWVATASAGLAAAQAGLTGTTLSDPPEDQTADVMIRGMVEGLAARVRSEGGSLAEWERLVRSRQMLDGDDAAREDLALGVSQLAGSERTALIALGDELGLSEDD